MSIKVVTTEPPANYDPEVAIRNLAYGVAMGYLFGPKVGIPNELAMPVGGLIAGAIDRGIFWLKGRLKIRRGK